MAYVARSHEFDSAEPYKALIPALPARPAPQAQPQRPGFWRSLYDSFANAQQRAAQREVARYIATHGKLTDSMEREIAERLLGQGRKFF